MNTYIKKLSLVGSVVPNDIVYETIELLNNEKAFVHDFEDFRDDYYQKYHPLTKEEFKKPDIWRTYAEYSYTEFYTNDGKLFGKTKICEKGIFQPVVKRCTVVIEYPIDFIENIKDAIDYTFDCYLEQKYEEHLENAKRKWMDKKAKELLSWDF